MKNEKRNKWLVALLAIAFLVMAFVTQGQVERYIRHDGNYNVITTVTPIKPMRYVADGADTLTQSIYLSILKDSIDLNNIKYEVYAYYPSHVNLNGAEIKIGFTDGSSTVLKQDKWSQKDNYSEFKLLPIDLENLKFKKFDYLLFSDIAQCVKIKDKDYFMKFLKE